MMKKTTSIMAGILLLNSSMAMAEGGPLDPGNFSANVALTTDYLFRGISQTEGNPALQGGFDYGYGPESLPVEFYVGVWASNIDFNDGADASLEVDYYGGVAGDLFSTGIGWDIGIIYYDYPSSESSADYEYIEYGGSLSYSFDNVQFSPEISVSAWYSPDFFGDTGDAIYVSPSIGLSLPYGFSIGAAYGYQDVDDTGEYDHIALSLSKDWGIFTFDVTYSDTFDTNDDFCSGGSDLCDSTVVFTVGAAF